MAQFLWTDDLSTGNDFIDGDHRKMVSLVNTLFDSMAKAEANNIVSKSLTDLIIFTTVHFGREEAEMQRIQYVAELSHRAEHAKLMDQIAELKRMLDAGKNINAIAVSGFLSDWLRHHILTVDKKLAAALKLPAKPAGNSMA